MTRKITKVRTLCAVGVASLALAGCEELGLPDLTNSTPSTTESETAAIPARAVPGEVERPNIFSEQGPAIWDGRPTLGGIWVASTKTTELERVRITHLGTGISVEGALFRIEPGSPGPSLTLSSDAARELSVVPGQPTDIRVVALRDNPAARPVAPPPAPEATATDSGQIATTEIAALAEPTTSGSTAAPLRTAIPATRPGTGGAAAPTATPVATTSTAPAAPPAPEVSGPILDIATFRDEAAADAALIRLASIGLTAQKTRQRNLLGSRWIIFAGPFETSQELIEARRAASEAGFENAFVRTE